MPSDLYDLDRKKREICSEGDATEAVTLGNPLRPGSTAGSVSLEDYSRLQMDSYFATTEYGVRRTERTLLPPGRMSASMRRSSTPQANIHY